MVDVDLGREVMIIEVQAGEYISDSETEERRPTTPAEKAAAIAHARGLIDGKSKAALYALSGSKKLVNPFKSME